MTRTLFIKTILTTMNHNSIYVYVYNYIFFSLFTFFKNSILFIFFSLTAPLHANNK